MSTNFQQKGSERFFDDDRLVATAIDHWVRSRRLIQFKETSKRADKSGARRSTNLNGAAC